MSAPLDEFSPVFAIAVAAESRSASARRIVPA